MARISALLPAQALSDDDQIPVVIGGKTRRASIGDLSEAASSRAELAAGLAEEFNQGISYASQAAGEAATTEGQFFRVPIGTTPETYTRYQRTAGGSVEAAPLATTADLASTDAAKGAALSAWKQDSIAAEDRDVRDKLLETVDVFDAMTPAMRAAIRNGDYIDVGPAIASISNYASGGESSSTVGGVELFFPPGRYSSSEPITNTFRFENEIVDDGDLRRLNVRGAGSANTTFFYEGPDTTPAYSVRGFNSVDGMELYHAVQGIRIRRQFGAQRGTGAGFYLRDVAEIMFRDVHVDGFDIGMDVEGVLGWYAQALFILGNNGGLNARLGDGFTRPNVFQFVGGKVSGNSTYGARFMDASNVSFLGTRFEANGAGEVGAEPNKANQFVLQMLGAPVEGGAWLSLDNCYLENNNVETEIDLQSSSANSGTVSVRNTSFQRISDTRNPNRHLDFNATGTGKVKVTLDATAFRSINGRTPNSNFKAWRNQTANTLVYETPSVLYENNVEGPDSGNFPHVGHYYEVFRVEVDGTTGAYHSSPLVSINARANAVVKAGTGKYSVYWNTNPSQVNVRASLRGAAGFATVTFQGSAGVDVETRDSTGALADLNFRVVAEGRF